MMKKNIIWILVSVMLVSTLVLASCGGEEETVTEEPTEEPTEGPVTEEPVTPPGGGNWWDKFGEPQYGGEIKVRLTTDPGAWDPYGNGMRMPWADYMGGYDWTVDRDICDFRYMYVPMLFTKGRLCESWEVQDLSTYIFHIRDDIYWQDKEPVNGRQFIAEDIAYHWSRQIGSGYGFTKPSPFMLTAQASIKSITATDKFTVVFNMNYPSLFHLHTLVDCTFFMGLSDPPEVIEKWGGIKDWTQVVGTGPWILNDYVAASSISYVKNTNYFMYDERHPENKLPYADEYKELIIPDSSTARAALRTGKIDYLEAISWEELSTITKTNPELEYVQVLGSSFCLDLRNDTEPFDDIRVRKAMQMALDLETIAASVYGGLVDWKPYGLIGPQIKNYYTVGDKLYTPFDEWPQEVKEGYAYNPEVARQLLAEAGYPDGFKTNMIIESNADLDMAQVIKSYLLDIGIDMEIRVIEASTFMSMARGRNYDQIAHSSSSAFAFDPDRALNRGVGSYTMNFTENNDPIFDDLYTKYTEALDPAEALKYCIEADKRAISQQWRVVTMPPPSYTLWQPWLKGYSGEAIGWRGSFYTARWWIDQDLKKAMGGQ